MCRSSEGASHVPTATRAALASGDSSTSAASCPSWSESASWLACSAATHSSSEMTPSPSVSTVVLRPRWARRCAPMLAARLVATADPSE
eukprot:6554368-Prymnesium_polylepis.2